MGLETWVRWFAPDAAPGAFNDWQLVSGAPWSPGALVGGGTLLLLALLLSAWGLRRVPWRRRAPILALRAGVALVVGGLLVEPTIELRAISRARARVAVLVDGSRSMGLATKGGTRAERVAHHIADHAAWFEALARRANVEWYVFDERSRPVEGPPGPVVDGPRSDLARALSEVSWPSSGRELGAVILYSDGADTAGLTEERARREAEALGVPIHTVGFGQGSAARDLAIRRIPADDFAFVHNTVTLEVDLEERGLGLAEVDVTLEQDGRILQTKPARFEGGRAHVAFEVKPRAIGKQVYRVSVPVQAGEAVEGNNEKSIVLKVIRDRIRVLQVAGRPSWDQRFLREILKRNPNVDLISFFILRSTTDLQKASQDELALIPFPVHELFTEEIETFDVVIYQNFSYRPYRMDRYLPNLRDYVMNGGGFMMIGGDQGFGDGWYAGTAVAEILPVRLGGTAPWDPAPFQPRLTDEGRLHPITRLGEPGEPAEAVFRRLPPLEGINLSTGLMPGASALLNHPSLPGNPPVVAVREVGEGRTLAVTTDSLWFWRFLAVSEGSSSREYDRFWSSALRWLVRDPELDRVRLRVDRSVALLGDPVGAQVQVLGPDYRALAGAEVTAEIAPAPGAREVELPEPRRLSTGEDGSALLRFEGIPPGSYVVRAEARHEGQIVGEAREPVIVEASDVELASPFPRPEILEALARASGGQALDVDASLPELELGATQRVEVHRSRRVPVWDTPWVVAALVLLAGAEWWMRRRAGLL